MASSYPGAVDALVRPDGTDPLSDGHAALHNATSDAVEAVQTELGVNPAGSEATVAARLTAAEGATAAAQGDATQALADAATADGKAVAAQGDATTGISNAATAQATANAAVPKATYDAHSVLAATTDNTPAAVTVGEQTIVGRKTGGNITALTAAETKTLLAIGQSDVTNLTSDLSAKAPLASPTFTGVPAAPTAAVDTATTQVATTAFTVAQIADDAVSKAAVGNLLTANQASLESNATTGWVLLSDCTIAASSAQAKAGTYSLAATYAGAAYGDFYTSASIPVVAGQTYTASTQSRAATTGRSVAAGILWFNSGNTYQATTNGTGVTNSTSGWTRSLVTAVAPAGAAYARPFFRANSAANLEVHYFDEIGLWEGAGGQWALPGTPITNLGFYTDESVGRRLFQWDANNSRWQMTYGDTGDRQSAITYTNGWANAYGVDMLRRIGNTVYLQVVLDSTSATTDGAFTVPAGFRPSAMAMMAVPVGGSTVVPRTLTMGSAGEATIYQASLAGQAGWFVGLAYQTNDAWPTSLPGTASGSIPA